MATFNDKSKFVTFSQIKNISLTNEGIFRCYERFQLQEPKYGLILVQKTESYHEMFSCQ